MVGTRAPTFPNGDRVPLGRSVERGMVARRALGRVQVPHARAALSTIDTRASPTYFGKAYVNSAPLAPLFFSRSLSDGRRARGAFRSVAVLSYARRPQNRR